MAIAMLVAVVDAASVCLVSPETIRNREIVLIYTALKNVVLEPDDLAEAVGTVGGGNSRTRDE